MMLCILKWRLISSYGISSLKKDDDVSYKCAIIRMKWIQTTIPRSVGRSLEDYLHDHDLTVNWTQGSSLIADGDPTIDEYWGPPARVETSSESGLKEYLCDGNISQRLRGLDFISGNLEDGSIDGGRGECATSITSQGETISVALRQCVSVGGRRGKKTAKPWRGRLKSRTCSYLQLFKDLPASGPTVFSTLTLLDRQSAPIQVPRYGHRPGLEDMAWISLDGRLMNAESATSLDRVGGLLGRGEACVWEGLTPLQRVLIVAVAAAAAANSKERSAQEVGRLQKVINDRETALVRMRRELSNLSTRVDGQRARINPSGKMDLEYSIAETALDDFLNQVDMQRPQSKTDGSGADSVSERPQPNYENSVSPAVNRQLSFCGVDKKSSSVKEESPISGGPGLELMEKMMLSNSWIEALDIGLLLEDAADEEQEYRFGEDSVNKDVVFEERGSGNGASQESGEAATGDSRPAGEWNHADLRFDPMQDNATANEWLSETSSVIMDPFSPQPLEKQSGRTPVVAGDSSKDWWTTRTTEAEAAGFTARARCANIILDVKKQVISLLDEAASNVLEALTCISEKARLLEGPESHALTPQKPEDAWNNKSHASTLIKESVNKASMRIATLQTTMVHLWHSLGPEAMASLNISPSEFDDYLTNLQIAKILNEDAAELSTENGCLQSWKEWFRRGFDNPESSFLRRIQVSDEDDLSSDPQMFDNPDHQSWTSAEWPPSGDIHARKTSESEPGLVTPAVSVGFTVREKVEKMLSPLHENTEADTTSADSCSNLVTVAEQLVAELEKSAAKVAGMEAQMKSLKKYVKASDLKRKQVERKLLEAWEQDSKNQVKAGNEIMELKRQVRLKETAYQELIRSRKALVAARSQEITELREECRRRDAALTDMTSGAKLTQEASEKKLAVLEEICRKKDQAIMTLKQEIFELEGKVQELQACQTPAQLLRPMNLPHDSSRDTDNDSMDDLLVNDRAYRLFGADDCQLRSSFTSMCGSETRRTSWGSDLSAQEFHIIDTPWSSELCGGEDFNVIEEAAFQGRSLSIFQNVNSSQEFSRGALRKLGEDLRTPGSAPSGGGSSSSRRAGDNSSSGASKRSDEPTGSGSSSSSRDSRLSRGNIPQYRRELSKSVSGMVTTRPKRRDESVRASTGVLATVGPNTPIKPKQRSSSVSKERQSRSNPQSVSQLLNNSLNNAGGKPKENATARGRQKWV